MHFYHSTDVISDLDATVFIVILEEVIVITYSIVTWKRLEPRMTDMEKSYSQCNM